jgi:hypothetical protein
LAGKRPGGSTHRGRSLRGIAHACLGSRSFPEGGASRLISLMRPRQRRASFAVGTAAKSGAAVTPST